MHISKLQFLNTTHKLPTNFHFKKINPFHFLNFFKWYEVENYTRYTSWQTKLIGDVIIGFVSKRFLVCKLHIRLMTKGMTSSLVAFLKGYRLYKFQLHTICKIWDSLGEWEGLDPSPSPFPPTNHICKMFRYQGLINVDFENSIWLHVGNTYLCQIWITST